MNSIEKKRWSCLAVVVVLGLALFGVISTAKTPWGCKWLSPGWGGSIRSIHEMEIALAKVRSDVPCDTLGDLLDSAGLEGVIKARALLKHMNAFEASTEVYTAALTAVMVHGRDAREVLAGSESTKDIAPLLKPESLKKLGRSYAEVEVDPWGNPYKLFVGPWPREWGPIVLRTYRIDEGSEVADPLTVRVAGDDEDRLVLGFPAETRDVYIWSSGPNEEFDQALFDSTGRYEPPAERHYRAGAPSKYLGGGDDINNWDGGLSWGHLHHESHG